MSAHDYQEVYSDLGIDLNKLGCVMLGTETIDTSFIDDDDLYYTKNPDLFWINGRAEGNSHITLKYGLLNSVRRKHVLKVIEGLPLPEYLTPDRIEKFDSPFPDEPYECIVLRVSTEHEGRGGGSGKKVMDLHNALNYLPHINTFPDYKPHITLAYVKKGWYTNHVWGGEKGTYPSTGDKPKTTSLDFGKML